MAAYIPPTVKSLVNTTTLPLGSAETYTGQPEYSPEVGVMVDCTADTNGTLYFDYSVDGENWITEPASGYNVTAGSNTVETALKGPRYFRARYVNGSSAQSYFRLYTYYGDFPQDLISPSVITNAIAGAPNASDASGRSRVAIINTLLDGKTINSDATAIWQSVGTGTDTFAGNMNNMAVAAGEYRIRQTLVYTPYFSGKSQLVEMTFDGFGLESGVIKRVGYYDSDGVAPYDANFDGWYLESNGVSGSYYLVVYNKGTLVHSSEFSTWVGYNNLVNYDWNNFTVMMADFLWLGGSELRIFIKDPSSSEFILAQVYRHAGNAQGVFFESPNKPVRYELLGVTGAGTMRAVCSSVGSEGSIGEAGELVGVFNDSTIAVTTGGDPYVLLAVRKSTAFYDTPIRMDTAGMAVTTNDGGILMLLEEPTVAGTLTWAANRRFDVAYGDGSQTVTDRGRVISAWPVVASGVTDRMTVNTLTWLGITIDRVPEHYVLAYLPLTTNQTVAGVMNLLEY